MFISVLKEAMPYLIEANIATMIVGHHGVGKSQAVRQYTDETTYNHPKLGKQHLGFIDLRLGTQDVGDLLGLADFERDSKGQLVATKFMRPDWFPTDPDSRGIIFLDEVNRARRDVLQAVFQLVLDKRLHRYELPKGWHVVAAMNPNTENYIVTDITDKAFLDRFCHIKLQPSIKEWFSYAQNKKFDSSITSFLKDQPELLSDGTLVDFDLKEVTPSRRSWEAVDRLVKAGTPLPILQELCYGLVGHAATAAYMASLKNADKPIAAEDVVANFDKYKERVEKYSNAETGGRIDLLKHTCDELQGYVENRKKKFSDKEKNNISNFLKTIPTDLSFALCKELYMCESIREVMDNDKELMNMLKKARANI